MTPCSLKFDFFFFVSVMMVFF